MALRSFSQSFNTASTEWTVTHNLGKAVISDAFVFNAENKPEKVLALDVIHVSDNQILVKFSIPRTGFVKVM